VIELIFNTTDNYRLESLFESSYLYPYSPPEIDPASSSSYQPLLKDVYLNPFHLSNNNNPFSSHSDLEKIVNPADPLESFFNSKKEVLLDFAKGLINQIYERIAISENNLYEMDKRISRANSVLDQLEVFELGSIPVIDKRKVVFEQELIGFEQEKRLEKVACWRDITRLKSQLLEIKQQISTQTNRQKLIYG
jgi:hypothetical protein